MHASILAFLRTEALGGAAVTREERKAGTFGAAGGNLRPVSAGRLDVGISDEIRRRIVSLNYPPGLMIFENAVAAEFGVSRTPVHQAFMRLSHEGLLDVLPQRGARVSFLSRSTIIHAQYVRECLEAAAFFDAARIWDAADAAHLQRERRAQDLIEAQREAVARGDYLRFTELDVAFHTEILGVLGNDLLLACVSQMRNQLNRLRLLELREAHHEKRMIADHEALLAAVSAGRADEARRRLITHLKTLEDFREEIFGRHPDLFRP
uniref:Transcriptional regulator, GntR family n=1 Tax=Cereibacter sphaeroides (strain ATCC 17025 / ATH 2.4.3) TaxID=349102 RepID=A4WXM5_CERS5